jgi:hypothetical protein
MTKAIVVISRSQGLGRSGLLYVEEVDLAPTSARP